MHLPPQVVHELLAAPRPEPQNPLRSTLRGDGFEAGAAVLSLRALAAPPPELDAELDARAAFHVHGVIGVDGWDLRAAVGGLETPPEVVRFVTSLMARWPAPTPLHLLPFPLALRVSVRTREPGDTVRTHALVVGKVAARPVLEVVDRAMERHLQTYLQSPATLGHLDV